jgi:hypothetical protein
MMLFLLTCTVFAKRDRSSVLDAATRRGAMGEPLPPTSEWAAESVGLVMQELTRRRVDVSRYMLVGHVGSLGCVAFSNRKSVDIALHVTVFSAA